MRNIGIEASKINTKLTRMRRRKMAAIKFAVAVIVWPASFSPLATIHASRDLASSGPAQSFAKKSLTLEVAAPRVSTLSLNFRKSRSSDWSAVKSGLDVSGAGMVPYRICEDEGQTGISGYASPVAIASALENAAARMPAGMATAVMPIKAIKAATTLPAAVTG